MPKSLRLELGDAHGKHKGQGDATGDIR
jgi:hypothetical protein